MNATVVKIGGSLLEDLHARGVVLDALAEAVIAGERLIVVHGGGRHIDRELGRRGIPKRVVNGLRITDGETLEVVTSVLSGLVNKTLVGELHARGVRAAGVSGLDASLLSALPHPPVEGTELGHVGVISRVDPLLVDLLFTAGVLPVVACLAIDAGGGALNVNADAAAASVAVAVEAARIVYLTDVEGYLDAEGQVTEQLSMQQCRDLLASGTLAGGMHPKIVSIISALEGGVAEAVIAGPSRHSTVLRNGKGGTRLVAA